jgi:hypothetical protein
MSGRRTTAVVVSLVLLGALAACTADEPVPGTRLGCSALTPGPDGYAVSGYALREVRPEPYACVSSNLVDLAEGRTDAVGAFVPELPDGLGPGYHPVGMAQHALWSLGSYRATDDPAYLDRAVATAGALLDGATSAPDGSLWFAYPWDHLLHGEEQMQLRAPWYSGMAQGQALHLFSELAAETDEERWRAAADGAFASYMSDGAGDYCHEIDLRPANYHRGVARQLDTLGLMTGDAAFLSLADQLDADYRSSGSSD